MQPRVFKSHKFTLKQAYQFGWPGLKGWAFNSKEDFNNASAAYFEISDSHGKTKSTFNDRIYFVIEGQGEFIINEQTFPVQKHDVIIIPKNTPYDYRTTKGVLKLFLVHTPAYQPDHEIKNPD